MAVFECILLIMCFDAGKTESKEFEGCDRVAHKQSEEKKILTECERKECCCVVQSPGEQSLLLWKTVLGAR